MTFMPVALILCLLSPLLPSRTLQGHAPPLHVLKITAGPAGSEANGTFLFAEERSSFNRTHDKEVIVMFQWEGVPGPHRLAAHWRSPDGSATSESTLQYVAKERRFGAYWRIAIIPTMAPGTWSIEATVDGQPGGRFSFEITDNTVVPGVVPKRPLLQQQLYDRLAQSYIVLTRTTTAGREVEPAGAVAGPAGQVFTAVKVLDESDRVQAVSAAGTKQELTDVVDLDRALGWAILDAPLGGIAELPRAPEAPNVGDQCYSMHGDAAGVRVLLQGQVTGKTQGTSGGLMVSFVNGAGTFGSPVVNEYGELIGLLGADPTPSRSFLRTTGGTVEFGNVPMIPIAAIAPRPGVAVSTLEARRKRGDLLEPLVGEAHVLSGGFATSISRGPLVGPENQRAEFSSADKELVVFVTWSPRDRLKGQTSFKVYNSANQLVTMSKPKKVDLRKNELVLSSWRIPVFQKPGTYRAEIHFQDKPAWRDYVRILP